MTLRGRHWIVGWLLLFLGVTTLVVVRDTVSLRAAGRLRALRAERMALEARRAEREQRLRDAMSRPVLVPKAEGLGLHLPADSEYVRIAAPWKAAGSER